MSKRKLYYTIANELDLYGVADNHLEIVAKSLKVNDVITSSIGVVYAFQALVKEDYFSYDEIELFFIKEDGNSVRVPMSRNGEIDWPTQFTYYYLNTLMRLIWDEKMQSNFDETWRS